MAWRQRCLCSLTGLALALAGAAAEAGPYSGLYVFGDSLSDSGNVLSITGGAPGGIPASAYYSDGPVVGRFTNGLNYIDRVAATLGLALTPSTTGGTNYAFGGARATYARADLAAYGALGFDKQVDRYLTDSGGVVDANALYVLWIGSNDMSDGFGQALMAGGSLAPIGAAATNAVTTLLTKFSTLEALGARHFAIGTVPDLGLTPAVQELAALYGDPGIAMLATGAAMAFNGALAASLPSFVAPGADVTLFDSFGLLRAVTADPLAYGLTDVADGCYNGQVDGTPTPGAGPITLCANPDGYIYFDTEHPSARAHQILADSLAAQLVPEPAGGWALTLGGLGLLGFMRRRPAAG